MKQEEIKACLTRKLAIMEKIQTNTATQQRFVRRRELRGLNRLLRERAILIDELGTVNDKLQRQDKENGLVEFKTLLQSIEIRQREILNDCDRVLQETLGVHRQIAAELSNIKTMRHLKGQYVGQWTVMARGHRFSAEG